MRSTRLTAIASMLLLGAVPAASAQVILEVQQGTTWATSLTMPEAQTMSFRWKWESGKPLVVGSWQITIIPSSSPPPGTTAPIAKQKSVSVPASKGEYASFQISPGDLPAGIVSTFYVRVQATTQGGMERVQSDWIRVFIGKRSTTAYVPQPAPPRRPAPVDPPFTIPGGGGVPMWVRLTKLICDTETSDGSDSDEIYAVLLAADLSAPASDPDQLGVVLTPVYEEMDAGEPRPANVVLWGPGGVAKNLSRPEDVIMLAVVMEADNGLGASWYGPSREAKEIRDFILPGLLSLRSKNPTRDEIRNYLSTLLMFEIGARNVTQPCFPQTCTVDEIVGAGPKEIRFTADQIAAAASGTVGKDEVTYGYSGSSEGKYVLRFQLGKSGISTVSW